MNSERRLVVIEKNQSFGYWTTIEHTTRKDKSGYNVDGWICLCSCGTVRWVKANSLISGKSKSCGCLKKQLAKDRLTKHGMSRSPIYKSYHSMMSRCYDKTHSSYKFYGGKTPVPIRVCERWHDINTFLNDAKLLPGYQDDMTGLTLDRLDNSKDYSPENCRWSTNLEQQNNKHNNVYVVWNEERCTIAELSRLEDVDYNRLIRIYQERKDSWDIEQIVSYAKKRRNINLAEIARKHNVSYNRLYHFHVTKGLSLEDSIEKINQLK